MDDIKNLSILNANNCVYQVSITRGIDVNMEERCTYDFYTFDCALAFADKAIKDPKVEYVSLSCFKFKEYDYEAIFGGNND